MNTLNLQNQQNLHNPNTVEFALNEPQALARMVRANVTVLLWGRGTGKTVGGIAPWVVDVAEELPGAMIAVPGMTHEHLSKNIIPKITLGLGLLNFKIGRDYVVGTKPPDHWPKCVYGTKLKWDKTMVWKSGTVFHQLSLREKGDANAFDFQGMLCDEAKYLDPNQLEDEVIPTLRGFAEKYEHSHLYQARLYASDKLYDYLKIKWLLDFRNQVNHETVQEVLDNELLISNLIQAKPEANSAQVLAISRAISKLTLKSNTLRKNLTYVSEASAIDNIDNLGLNWLLHKKKSLTPYRFNVSIKNEDPIHSETKFYHALDENHFYPQQYPNFDYDPNKPFIIALDYQHSVAPIMCAQVNDKVNNRLQLNYINEFDTVYPHGIPEALKMLADYYIPLGLKKVFYIYDQTAKGKRAGADPLYKIVIRTLKRLGIITREIYMGDTPDHIDKYIQINESLSENKWITIGFNSQTIINSRQSLFGAGTRIPNGVTKKDKELENAGKYPSIDQRHTTHYSDVFDQIEWAVIEQKLIQLKSFSIGAGIATR